MVGAKRSKAEAAALRANASFYEAFSRSDYQAMASLWAERSTVSCLHPGSPALVGRERVLESWRQILLEAPPLEMRCEGATVQTVGEVAIVTCYEGNASHPAHLAATNVFVLEEGTYRLLHHHAAPLSSPIALPTPADTSSFN